MLSFFSLPVKTSTGERLSHEEVVAKLDDETVHYEIDFGMQYYFSEVLRVGIEVEKKNYEYALRWLKDLIFGSEFDIGRLAWSSLCQILCLISIYSFTKITNNLCEDHAKPSGTEERW